MPKNRLDKREPDITFVLDGQEYVIDVTFCKLKNVQQSAFDEKIRKYSVMGTDGKALYPRDRIVPIVINYRGTVFQQSKDLLKDFLPEIDIMELQAATVKEIVRSSFHAYNKYTRIAQRQIVEGKVPLKSQDAFGEGEWEEAIGSAESQ